MEVLTSYFYQIRNFTQEYVPVSTALFDPKWYHNDSYNKNHVWINPKTKVVTGLRFDAFAPGKSCEGLCRGPQGCKSIPTSCSFLSEYKKQIESVDFDGVMSALKIIEDTMKKTYGIENVKIVFIFYETPDNPCSERRVVQDYFNSRGVKCTEYRKD